MGQVNLRKLIAINAKIVIAISVVFGFVVFMGAKNEITWIDFIAIPVCLSILIVGILNVAIYVSTRMREPKY